MIRQVEKPKVGLLVTALLEDELIVGEGDALPLKPRPTVAPQMLFRPVESTLEEFYDRWCLAGAGHHSAVAYGHLGEALVALAEIMQVDFELVR